ncbi:hypothetical protein [Bifidobacterium phasiani]|uniref:Uncharacterized protein n=1 Tax=Bifidobacterium phasiani TaxID=2834431 RepID=A0ABS6W672_9BIFI|nr:hypothetical protein [Bifidobacterium phasiani]MBW3081983.1 hypothetical protein [Bifidobacterium phasiani]
MPVEYETAEERSARNDKQIANALQWLDDHWTKNRECPLCGTTDWALVQTFEAREYEGGNMVVGLGSQILPITPVFCRNCGYTFFINAVIAGSAIAPEENKEQKR